MQTVFWLVMARVAGLFVGAPVLSLAAMPARFRILMTAALSLSLLPIARPEVMPNGADALAVGLLGEFMIGMSLGLLARLLMTAFQVAGTVMGFQMGLAMANQLDPTTQDQTSVVGILHLNAATVAFLLLDGHHLLIRGLAASYETFPLGAPLRSDVLASVISNFGSAMWSIGLRVKAPVTGIMLLVNGVLGFLNRVNPQFSIFNVGFPLTSFTGFAALLLAFPGSINAFVTAYGVLEDGILDLLGR
jgi:flagellar biosynthetic protein FliR